MIVTAVIPVSGREPLLRYVIGRLKHQTVPINVLCCGHTESERAVCESEGADFFFADEGESAGSKWQKLIDISRYAYNTEAILILGSSNMITHNWCEELTKHIKPGVGMIGVLGLYYLDIFKNGGKRMFYWGGYAPPSGRVGEPIGTGRILTREFLDAADWEVYPDKRCMLDAHVRDAVKASGLRTVIHHGSAKGLRISTFKWKQINKYDAVGAGPTARHMNEPQITEFLTEYFPEANGIFQDLCD